MIGIYGGTFNPIHYGHLRTALDVHESLMLDELRLLPCALPAHRHNPKVSADKRLHMLMLAIKGYPQFNSDTRELGRKGTSYMVDTLASIRAEIAQNVPLLLIMGSDAFNYLPTWYRWQRLFDYAHIVVMTRPGSLPDMAMDFYQERQVYDRQSLKLCSSGKIYFQEVTQLDISASMIRKKLAEHKNISFLVPELVIKYIQAQQLYCA